MSDYWKEIEATAAPSGSKNDDEFLVPTNGRLALRVRTAAGWIWAVAALSAVNLALSYAGAPIRAVYSIFSTEFLYAIGVALGPIWSVVALVIASIAIAGTGALGFAMFLYHRWAFIAAMALLGLDAAVIYKWTTLAGLGPFLIHGLAIYFVWVGFKAAKLYHERKRAGQV